MGSKSKNFALDVVGHSVTRNVEKMTLMDTVVVGCIEFLYFFFHKN
jgi:hypothetical protein